MRRSASLSQRFQDLISWHLGEWPKFNFGTFQPDYVPYQAAVVYHKTQITLTNLRHFQEYNIEVVACHEYNERLDEKLCSNRAITTGRTAASREYNDYGGFNPLRAKFFRWNMNIFLHFMSLLHIDMTQVLKIVPQVRPGPSYST